MHEELGFKFVERLPFNDLTPQWDVIADAARADVEDMFRTSAFCLGPFVERFETEIASYLGVPHAIGLNSGTSALHLAMLAAGCGPGDDVLVPAHTFIATIWGVLYAGANPVLCDVNAETGTIDLIDAERRLTPRSKAIVPVHLYGQPADMAAVLAFAERHGLEVVEDNAQAIGARWEGRSLGSLGRFGCYSFYPGKVLGAAGEAGLITTADARAAKRIRALRNHGQSQRYVHEEIGFNYRMDGFQGLVLTHKLRGLDQQLARRRDIARLYGEQLGGLPVRLPAVCHGDHVWHLYVIRTERRDELRAHLATGGIETGLHYPVPNHRQPCLASLPIDRESYPESDRWANECLSLPIFFGMSDDQVGRVAAAVRTFYS